MLEVQRRGPRVPSIPVGKALPLLDLAPEAGDLRRDALAGLAASPKTLPCKYFYDDHGSWLFDQICSLPEYYPTRTELAISHQYAAEMAAACGPQVLLLELGSGSSTKTRVLLDHLRAPAGYVPVDIAREFLRSAADDLASAYAGLPVLPVCADFTRPFTAPVLPARRTVVYFPGSTIGNFTAGEATLLLRNIGRLMGDAGGLLIGVDLRKDTAVLERAYNDARGVTAAFNLNLLTRLNRELAADFDLTQFQHRAIWDPGPGRIEMQLVSTRAQTVHIDGQSFAFTADEHIRTEYSHKYTLEQFAGMATAAGLAVRKVWTDRASLFSVQYLTRA
ncbi:MAG TPA: L-histidine N(alpha)-methyltransferase [Nannocystis sp.]|jgi:dimethylhistidine N-methyltransferase